MAKKCVTIEQDICKPKNRKNCKDFRKVLTTYIR